MIRESEKTKEQLLEEISRLRNRIRNLELGNNNADDVLLYEKEKVRELQMGFESTLLICKIIGDGEDFRIDIVTPPVLKSDSNDRYISNGDLISEVFPLVSKSGLLSSMKSVYDTGHPEYKVFSHYNHKDIKGWWAYNIFKLPDSRIALVQNEVSLFHNMVISLYNSDQRFKELQRSVPIGLFKSKPDGTLLYVNEWASHIFGYDSPKDLLKVNMKDLYVYPELRGEVLSKLFSEGKLIETEMLFKKKDGTPVWVIASSKLTYDKAGNVESLNGYVYDITERKIALDQLKDSEEMFRQLSENLRSAVYIFNKEGTFIYTNNATSEITGYSVEELLTMSFYEVVHPDFVDVVRDRGFSRVKGKDAPRTYEFKILTKQGKEKWLEITASLMNLKGEPVVIGTGSDVTERKQAEKRIKQNEQKYKSLYTFFRLLSDNNPDLIWAKDIWGRYIFVNKSTCDNLLFAKDTEEPIGKTDAYFADREKLSHPGVENWYTIGSRSQEQDDIVLKSNKPQRFDISGYVRGKYIHLDVYKSPMWNEDGKLIGVVGSARNITKERLIEKERLRFEKVQHVLYNIGSAVNTTKNLNDLMKAIRQELGKVIDTTNFYIALFDKKTNSLLLPYFVDEKDVIETTITGNSLTGYLIKQNKPLLLREQELTSLIDGGNAKMQGTMAKVWLGVPLREKGEAIGALVVQNYEDENAYGDKELQLMEYVSNQVSISINQKRADDALRESEARLRKIIDTVPHLIFAKDEESRFILANKATAEAYGLKVEDIEGKKQSELHMIKSQFERFKEDDADVFENNRTKVIPELTFTDANGNDRIFYTIKIPFNAGHGEKALLGVAIDITDTYKAKLELSRAKERAEESDRLKTAFLANMSHEIRTPMNAIVGFSELLNDSDMDSETRGGFIDLINQNSKLLLRLIEDIIDIAKIESDQLRIVQSTCQVSQIFDDLKNTYSNYLREKGIKNIEFIISKGIPGDDFSILSDPYRFKQIMNNLISNAIKFTKEGVIEIGYKRHPDNKVLFYVKDSGIGLPPDKAEVIFERFRQAEESSTKEYGGTGLGLTISKKLVELLGGSIWVESELNKGSVFYFTLPDIPATRTVEVKPPVQKRETLDWSDKTILVVEDEDSNFELVEATLFQTKVKILHAVNGKEAVEICRQRDDIDVVLMDMRMPVMNGYEATEIIKAEKPDLPVISLTAYAMAEDRQKSIQAGCDDYISKPILPGKFIETINKYID